jgi:hypothetical protein
MTLGTLYGSVSESNGLYGIGQPIPGSTYFEWLIFFTSATQPATPTGGSWNFDTNVGTPPTGWTNANPALPVYPVWMSIAFVDSRNPTVITWSVPGLLANSVSGNASTVPYVPAGTGAVTTTVQAKLRESVSVLDFGAHSITEVGYSTFDSTSAINAAITFALTFNGEVIFPAGTYIVSNSVKMWGTYSGQGVNLTGQGGGSSASSRATLQWKGNSATDSIIHLRGVSRCIISNINMGSSNIDTYPHLGGIFVQSGQTFGGPSSSGVQIKDCIVNGGVGTNSYSVRLGEDNLQVSECFCENVLAQSSYSNSAPAYITEYGFIITSNNTKDMTFLGCSQAFFQKGGVYYPVSISGWHTWLNLGGGQSLVDFYINGSGDLTIIGGGSEGSNKALIQYGGGSNPGTITMHGYQAEELSPADAYFIEMGQSNLVLDGCRFSCSPPANLFYIKYADAALSNYSSSTNQSLVSVGNWYRNATTFIPVWSYGPINSTIVGASLAPVRVFSTGDKGGQAGSIVHLPTVYGDNPQKFASLSYTNSNWSTTRALPFSASVKGVSTVIQKYTIPYTYLVDASLTANFAFLDIQAGGKVVGVYANVTQAFVLGASTINLAIGYGGSSNEFILAKTISGFTGPVGQADADLGTALARATAVQSGYINLSATTTVTAKFTSTVGNFGNGTVTTATAGNVIIYVAVQDFS